MPQVKLQVDRPYRSLSIATYVTPSLHTTRYLHNMVGRCGNFSMERRRPKCPSRAQTGCEAYDRHLVLLDKRTTPVLAFDRPRKQKQQRYSRFLNLPLDVLEQIFEYLVIAPAEIYLGVVALEHQLPHHWHPAYSLRLDEPRDNRHGESGLGRTPICLHRRAQTPYGLCSNILLVNRQLHAIAIRMLYGRNTFAIDIGVPTTYEDAQSHDISRLRLEQVIPLNPAYHKLLRRVSFRHYNDRMHEYPVRFFHSAMVHLLQDIPGAYTAFRRRYNTEYNLFDFETFAGWSPTATPNWLADAVASLATSQPLKTSNTSIHIDDVHRLMSTLWEKPIHSHSRTPPTREQNLLVDLCVMSNTSVSTGPYDPDEPKTWPSGRILLARLRNDESEHHWPHDPKRAWYEFQALARFQTWIVGRSKGFQVADVHELQRRRSCSPVWRAGPRGKKRRVFTAPLSFIVPPICKFLRAGQLKREDRRWRRDGGSNEMLVLPVDSDGTEQHWCKRMPIDCWPLQYEYV